MENMFELLNTAARVEDAPDARPLVLTKAALEFRRVCFSYDPERPVLKDVSFKVAGGQTVALVGSTGSGKSTTLRLLLRFYDVASGSILLDGTDVRAVTQLSLRAAIGVVPQDTVLFNDTIRYNIAYGCADATQQEVQEAAAAASLHDAVVTRFPQQYDTVVGERGLRLSGGEKQRVAFARAIIKNPGVLVLDEATSALDSITEKEIQGCLRSLRAVRTTVIVAHRLSTVMDADLIVVLADGCIVERGSHAELLERRGNYYDLWTRQHADDDSHAPAASAPAPADPLL